MHRWSSICLDFICKLLLCCFGLYSILLAVTQIYSIDIDLYVVLKYSFITMLSFILIVQSIETSIFGILLLSYTLYRIDYRYLDKVVDSFKFVGQNFILKAINAGYRIDFDFGVDISNLDFISYMFYSNIAFYTVMILISFFISIYVYKKSYPVLITAIITTILMPGILLNFMPEIQIFKCIISFIAAIFAVKIVGRIRQHNSENIDKSKKLKFKIYSTTYMSRYILAVFAATYILNSVGTDEIKPDLNFIDKIFSEIRFAVQKNKSAIPISLNIGFSGGSKNGELGEGRFYYSDKAIMDVYSNTTAPIYLRAWVGQNYSNNRWFSFENEDMKNYLDSFGENFMPEQLTWDFFKTIGNIDSMTKLVDENTYLTDVKLKYINAQKDFAYIPSLCIDTNQYFDSGYFKNKGEGMITLNRYSNSEYEYTLKSIMPVYSDNSKFMNFLVDSGEKMYRYSVADDSNYIDLKDKYNRFVYENYLYLPVSIFDKLMDLAKTITVSDINNFERAISIQNYLSKNYTYNLNPPISSDRDTDFVEYFLFDSKQGYCTYYATSMVLMLRTLGIPARYVEGYLVQGDSTKQEDGLYKRTIFDRDAHAWPEVYFDSIGWLPFEPTVVYTEQLFEAKTTSPDESINLSEYRYTDLYETPHEGIENEDVLQDIYQQNIQDNASKEEFKFDFKIDRNIIFLISILCICLGIVFIILNLISKKSMSKNADEVESTVTSIFKILEHMKFSRQYNQLPKSFAYEVDRDLNTDIKFSDITDIILKYRFKNRDISQSDIHKLNEYKSIVLQLAYSRCNILKRIYLRFFI